MHLRTSNSLREPMRHASESLHALAGPRPRRTLAGLLLLGLLVAFGIWVWPEAQRTIRIHRM